MRQVWGKVLLLLGGIATVWGIVALFSELWHALIAFFVALVCFVGSRFVTPSGTGSFSASTLRPADTSVSTPDAAPTVISTPAVDVGEDEVAEVDGDVSRQPEGVELQDAGAVGSEGDADELDELVEDDDHADDDDEPLADEVAR